MLQKLKKNPAETKDEMLRLISRIMSLVQLWQSMPVYDFFADLFIIFQVYFQHYFFSRGLQQVLGSNQTQKVNNFTAIYLHIYSLVCWSSYLYFQDLHV